MIANVSCKRFTGVISEKHLVHGQYNKGRYTIRSKTVGELNCQRRKTRLRFKLHVNRADRKLLICKLHVKFSHQCEKAITIRCVVSGDWRARTVLSYFINFYQFFRILITPHVLVTSEREPKRDGLATRGK